MAYKGVQACKRIVWGLYVPNHCTPIKMAYTDVVVWGLYSHIQCTPMGC